MKIKTPEEFVDRQPDEYREHLENFRRIIKETIPIADELISYQVICYKYHYMLVGIGTKKDNISFYTMSPRLVKRMADSLQDFKYTESTIYFPIKKELPHKLIVELIQERIIENEQRADQKIIEAK